MLVRVPPPFIEYDGTSVTVIIGEILNRDSTGVTVIIGEILERDDTDGELLAMNEVETLPD